MPKLNQAGEDLIKKYEGFSLIPYQDIKGIWTIGFGSTHGISADTPPITQEQAEALFQSDISHTCASVLQYIYPAILNDNQFSALVSLCYNCGQAPLRGTLGSYIRAGNLKDAANQFDIWCHANGKVIVGLQLRRAAEKVLFLTI